MKLRFVFCVTTARRQHRIHVSKLLSDEPKLIHIIWDLWRSNFTSNTISITHPKIVFNPYYWTDQTMCSFLLIAPPYIHIKQKRKLKCEGPCRMQLPTIAYHSWYIQRLRVHPPYIQNMQSRDKYFQSLLLQSTIRKGNQNVFQRHALRTTTSRINVHAPNLMEHPSKQIDEATKALHLPHFHHNSREWSKKRRSDDEQKWEKIVKKTSR